MNLILLDPEEIRDGEAALTGRRAAHVIGVLGARPGDTLRVGVVRGARGTAEVLAAGAGAVRLRVALEAAPAPRPPVDLLLAVPRPKVLRRVLRTLAAAGVGRVDLVNAWRVDKSYLLSAALAPAEVEAQLRLGAEQGASPWVPEHAVHPRLMPWLDEVLPARDPAERRVLAHPRAAAPLEGVVPPGTPGRVLVAVGPEGGWIPREVATFEARGFATCHLGEAVLDVAPAVASLLGQLALLRRLPPPGGGNAAGA